LTRRRVVVTGASGTVGSALLRELDASADVTGLDRRRPSRAAHGREVRRVDLRRASAARRAFSGVDTVVHLAAIASGEASWQGVLDTNVRLTSNVLEGAAAAGVRRVVLASSNHVVGGYEREEPYRCIVEGDVAGVDRKGVRRLTAETTVRPDSPYAVGKVMDEAAGRYFAEERGLSVLALRIGTVRPADRPESVRHLATFLAHRDLAQLVACCVDAPDDVRFGVFFGVSDNTWAFWDIDEARSTLGYDPSFDAEVWRERINGGR